MLFTSIIYFLFLFGTLFSYYLIPARFRNLFLIGVSFWFLIYAQVSYVILILFVIAINYFLGILIEKSDSKRKKNLFFYLSLLANLSVLIFFKYWNFLIVNIFELLGWLNLKNTVNPPFLDFALPIGLSYYIFQNIGYITDIKRGTTKAETNIYKFTLFTIYFPKLSVGPIERANHFLPQLNRKIYLEKENLIEGGKRITWGLFKKLVVADRISLYHTAVVTHLEHESGITLLIASLLYTFQVYADFSGYTDIALGTSQLFGFRLMENFKQPLLAKNISDFWRRWHISLSSWVNDYIFNPIALKYRDLGQLGVYFALFVSFVVIGIWHGAAWTYVLFGVLQALALIYETITRKVRKKILKKMSKEIYNNLSIFLTFLFISFSLIIFQSATLSAAIDIIKGIFTHPGKLFIDKPSTILFILIGIGIMMLYDLQEEYRLFRFSLFSNNNWLIQQLSYAFLLIYILLAGVFDGGQFIYFAF